MRNRFNRPDNAPRSAMADRARPVRPERHPDAGSQPPFDAAALAPAFARLVELCQTFGVSVPQAVAEGCRRFAELLLQANATRNLTRLTEPDRLVIGMFVDSLLFLRPLAGLPHGTILDVGTGAGFPAVPLALALPDSSIVAIDSRLMKIEFLQEAAERLGLRNLAARHVRAEDYAAEFGAARMDVVVARALAHPAEALTLTLPLVRPKGAVVLAVGTRGLAEELAAGAACLKRFHSSAADPSPYRLPGYDNDFAHVVVTRAQ